MIVANFRTEDVDSNDYKIFTTMLKAMEFVSAQEFVEGCVRRILTNVSCTEKQQLAILVASSQLTSSRPDVLDRMLMFILYGKWSGALGGLVIEEFDFVTRKSIIKQCYEEARAVVQGIVDTLSPLAGRDWVDGDWTSPEESV
jgi:hypothetical protein